MLMLGANVAYAVAPPLPSVNIKNRYGVNMASGTISTDINMLSIGGSFGISQSYRINTNSLISENPTLDPNGSTKLTYIWEGPNDNLEGNAEARDIFVMKDWNGMPKQLPLPADFNRIDNFTDAGDLQHKTTFWTCPFFFVARWDTTDGLFFKNLMAMNVPSDATKYSGLDLMFVSDLQETARFKILRKPDFTSNIETYPAFYDSKGVAHRCDYYPVANAIDFVLARKRSGFPTWGPDRYAYESIGDKRHSLVAQGALLIWTKPDGTKVTYERTSAAPSPIDPGQMKKIEYPNGFTLTFYKKDNGKNTLVVSNTGFAIRYNYLINSSEWQQKHPESLLAINLAEESVTPDKTKIYRSTNSDCPSGTPSASCIKLNNIWPTASVQWPASMPSDMIYGDSSVTFTNDANQKTIFTLKKFRKYLTEAGAPITGYPEEYVPRITNITLPGATINQFSYEYKNTNNYVAVNNGAAAMYIAPGDTAIISKATKFSNSTPIFSADPLNPLPPTGLDPYGVSVIQRFDGEFNVKSRDGVLGLYSVNNIEARVDYEHNIRNFPEIAVPAAGPQKIYNYTAQGNMWQVKMDPNPNASSTSNLGTPPTLTSSAISVTYPPLEPASLTEPYRCAKPKTCNQPTAIDNPRTLNSPAVTTTYDYHPESGQVTKITYPADEQGIQKVERTTYAAYYAKYFGAQGDFSKKELSTSPVYLKSSEMFCANSTTKADGSCTGQDKITTTYEYLHDNLLMTGKVVTSEADNKSLRTCYQYDKYGRKIGETQPKANLTSCP